MQSCGEQPLDVWRDLKVTWTWRHFSDTHVVGGWSPFQSASTGLSLRFQTSELPGPGTYVVRGEVPDPVSPNGREAFADFTIYLGHPPPPFIQLLSPSKVSVGCDIVLDASQSEDPTGATLSWEWSCNQVGGDTADLLSSCAAVALAAGDVSKLSIPRGTLVAGEVYEFTVKVSRTGTYAADSIRSASVEAVDASFPSVSLAAAPDEVSPQKEFELLASSEDSGDCQVPPIQTWWLVTADGSSAVAVSSTDAGMNLFLPAPLPVPPGSYFVRLLLSETANVAWTFEGDGTFAYDSNHFVVDTPPIGGGCNVTPSVATLPSEIALSTWGWQDDDLPLLYIFSISDSWTDWQVLQPWSYQSSMSSVMGNIGTNSVRAQALDTIGSKSTSAVKTFILEQPTEALSNDDIMQVLSSTALQGDGSTTVAAVGSLASQVKDPDMISVLLDALDESVSLEDSPEMIDGYSASLKTVAASALSEGSALVDTAIANKVMGMSYGVISAAESNDGLGDQAAQNLLSGSLSLSAVVVAPQADGESVSNSTTSAQAAFSNQLVGLVTDHIPKASMMSKPVGWSGTIEVGGELKLSLFMTKIPPAVVSSNVTLVVSSFVIPLGAIYENMNDTERGSMDKCGLEFAGVEWPENPHGYAGSGTNAGADQATLEAEQNAAAAVDTDGTVLEGEADCCTVTKKVQTLKIGTCADALMVNNLSEPIHFVVEATQLSGSSITVTYDPDLVYEELTIVTNSTSRCVYWDTAQGKWSDEGCNVTGRNDTHILCSCDHLTSFTSAFGNTFGKFGNNGLGLLTKPPKVDFTHGPFILMLCWFLIVYSPCIYCCWKDTKDYPWLSKRKELFKDKVPKGSSDFLCLCMPGFRVCSGLIACMPIYINCSLLKRRLKWLFCGGCFHEAKKKAALLETAYEQKMQILKEPERSTWVGLYGPEISVEVAGDDGHQLMWLCTEPAMRESLRAIISDCRRDYLRLTHVLGIAGELGRKGSQKKEDAASRKYTSKAIQEARAMGKKRTVELHDMNSGSGRQLLFQVELSHALVSHATAHLEETKLKPQRAGRLHQTVSSYQAQFEDQLVKIMNHERPMAPLLPPLNSFRVSVASMAQAGASYHHHRYAETQIVEGLMYFMWPHRNGEQLEIAMHGAVQHADGSWHLQDFSFSRMFTVKKGTSLQASVEQSSTEEENSTSHRGLLLSMHLQDGDDDRGHLVVRLADGSMQASLEVLRQWCKEISHPDWLRHWHDTRHADEVCVQLKSRPFGWLAKARHVHLARKVSQKGDDTTDGVGLILTAINPDSYAEKLGLTHGMVLLRLEGKDVRQMPSSSIAQFLWIHPMPFTATFSAPLRPDLQVVLEGKHTAALFNVAHRGMALRSCALGSQIFPDLGLREFDEILEIDGTPCYDALGNGTIADREFRAAKRKLINEKSVTLGILRPAASTVPEYVRDICELSSIFRYNCGICVPHTAAGPLVVYVQNSCKPNVCMCDIWFSHGGLALSMQPKLNVDFCLGLYLEDVASIQIESPQQVIDEKPAKQAQEAVTIVSEFDNQWHHQWSMGAEGNGNTDDVLPAVNWANPTTLWRVNLTLEPHGDTNGNYVTLDPHSDEKGNAEMQGNGEIPGDRQTGGDEETEGDFDLLATIMEAKHSGKGRLVISMEGNGEMEGDRETEGDIDTAATNLENEHSGQVQFVIGSPSKWVVMKSHLRLVQAFMSTYLAGSMHPEHSKFKNETEVASMHERLGQEKIQKFKFASKSHNGTGSFLEQMNSGAGYQAVFEQFKTRNAARGKEPLKVGDVAGKVTYHFWSKSRIMQTITKREQPLPKLFKHVPPLTRAERYAILSSALQTAFFFQTMLFSPNCFMQPKPAGCKAAAAYYTKFLPTWSTFAGAIFGLCTSVPVPFFFMSIFKKAPVLEKLTPAEKELRIKTWRVWQGFGWTCAAALHTFYVYWLTVFANEYDWSVFAKWVNAGGQSLLHRFISAPMLRASILLLVILLSTRCPWCDPILSTFPHILPVESIKKPKDVSVNSVDLSQKENGRHAPDHSHVLHHEEEVHID